MKTRGPDGSAVSVAGNVGHIQPAPGHAIALTDRLTAATSPLAAFAGLTVGLLVLRMNRQHAAPSTPQTRAARLTPVPAAAASRNGHCEPATAFVTGPSNAAVQGQPLVSAVGRDSR